MDYDILDNGCSDIVEDSDIEQVSNPRKKERSNLKLTPGLRKKTIVFKTTAPPKFKKSLNFMKLQEIYDILYFLAESQGHPKEFILSGKQ